MSDTVRLEELCNVRHQWVIGVGVREQRANRQEHLGNRQCRAPLVLQNVEADAAIRVNVAVVNTSRKVHLGWLE